MSQDDGTAKKFFVSSGSVTINEDSSVQILAEEAHPVEDLDAAACRLMKIKLYSNPLFGNLNLISREVLSKAQADLSKAGDDVAKAEAQIAVEVFWLNIFLILWLNSVLFRSAKLSWQQFSE